MYLILIIVAIFICSKIEVYSDEKRVKKYHEEQKELGLK